MTEKQALLGGKGGKGGKGRNGRKRLKGQG